MIPSKNDTFKVASDSADYRTVHDFLRKHGRSIKGLTFPTIMYFRDEELIGVMGTRKVSYGILADPMALELEGLPNPGFRVLRLIELYESVLRKYKVEAYVFYIFADQPRWKEMIEDISGMKPSYEKDGKVWYIRRLA